ncbi:MAG: ABC transporter substrate-binding protein [Arcobacter sp.]|nr:MAG: ABC transporter substrate-binding protein [Arcobacter sp.]
MKKTIIFFCLFFTFCLNAKVLKVVGPLEIKGLEPTKAGYIYSRLQIAENLMTIDNNGEIKANLAKSWDVSKDGLTWSFKLRDDVIFHDGSKFNANIVSFNLNREELLKKSILRYLPLEKIYAENTNTLIVKLKTPFIALPSYFVHYSTVILAKSSFDEKGKVKKVIGTGAFEIANITIPIAIKVKRFDNWWNGKAKVENISYTSVSKNETRALMMKTHQSDIAFSLLPISLKSLKRDSHLNTETVTIFRTRKLKVNSGSEFLSDKRVRHAISYALDRKGISKVILHNESLAATQMLPPSMPLWHNKDIEPLKQDITKAKALLKEAGWIKAKDGFVYKDNKKFAIDLITYSNWPELPMIATAVQSQLKEIGIDLKVSITNSSEVVRRHKDNSLQLALISKNFTLVPNAIAALLQDYGKKGGSWGAMNWESKEMIETLELLKKEDNPQLYYKITKILQEDLPTIPLTWSDLAVVYSKHLKGLKVDPFEISYNLSDVSFK